MNTENNKIIAEFMGKKLPYKNEKGDWEFYVEDAGLINSPNIEDLNRFLGFNYNTDWNWLMEVVEKIKKETNEDEFLSRLTTTKSRKAIDLENTLENCFRKSYLSIEAVYNACVEFIKWYNEQKINP